MITPLNIQLGLDINILDHVSRSIYKYVLINFQIKDPRERSIELIYDLKYLPENTQHAYTIECHMINRFITTVKHNIKTKHNYPDIFNLIGRR